MCCTLRNIKYFIMLQLSLSGVSDWQVYTAEESSSFYPIREVLRQDAGGYKDFHKGPATDSQKGARDKYKISTKATKITKALTRTTLELISRWHYCDHMAHPCLHAFVTGKICAVTVYDKYHTFDTFCLMEYVNCREGSEIWRLSYTGECFADPDFATEYMMYAYHEDHFLDDYYVLNDKTMV